MEILGAAIVLSRSQFHFSNRLPGTPHPECIAAWGWQPYDMEMVSGEMKCDAAAQLYLDLMKKCLTRYIFPEAYRPIKSRPSREYHLVAWAIYPFLAPVLEKLDIKLYRHAPVDQAMREDGRDWTGVFWEKLR
jgi:hypothetical protein